MKVYRLLVVGWLALVCATGLLGAAGGVHYDSPGGAPFLGTGVDPLVSGSFRSSGADPADSGLLRGLNNAVVLACEIATPGTDMTLTCNSSDQFAFSHDVTLATADITLDEVRGNSTGGVWDMTGTDGCVTLETAAASQTSTVCATSGGFRVSNNILTFNSGSFVITDGSGNTLAQIATNGLSLGSDDFVRWFSDTTIVTGAYDLRLSRLGSGNLLIDNNAGGAAAVMQVTTDDRVDFQDSAGSVGATVTAGRFANAAIATIAADDTTPSVAGANYYTTSANTGATAITDLDDPIAGQIVIICGGSDTNSSTIADSGNFALEGAFTAALDDCITLLVQADNDYVEITRSNN